MTCRPSSWLKRQVPLARPRSCPGNGLVIVPERPHLRGRMLTEHLEHPGQAEIDVACDHERDLGWRRGRLAIEDEPRDFTNLGTTDVQDGRAKIPDDRLPAPLRVSPDGHGPFPGVVQSKSAGAGAMAVWGNPEWSGKPVVWD